MEKQLDQIAGLMDEAGNIAKSLNDPALKSPESTVHLDAAIAHLRNGNLAEARVRLADHAAILKRSPAPKPAAPPK